MKWKNVRWIFEELVQKLEIALGVFAILFAIIVVCGVLTYFAIGFINWFCV